MLFNARLLSSILCLVFLLSVLPVAAQEREAPLDLELRGLLESQGLIETVTLPNGELLDKVTIPGSPVPPEGVERPVANPPEGLSPKATNILSNIPAFDWCYGCAATAGAMMAGYYDNIGYPNMYAGPANGGVCPVNNETTWAAGESPLSATHQGFDGLGVRGHVDDYWIAVDSAQADPYIPGGWSQHTYADCTADYMYTNQSYMGNVDGSTTVYFMLDGSRTNWNEVPPPVYYDGGAGLKLFFESRGYTVNRAYNQYIEEWGAGQGFSYNDFKAQIDAGRPVMIHVVGHAMLGYGYDDSTSNKVYIHDTWDHLDHTFTWGSSYAAMQHMGVTVIELEPPTTNTIYVKKGSNGAGSSWADAYGGLQSALDAAVSGDEIWVAAGTYTPTATHGGTSARYQSFQMKNGVEIYGGFPTTGNPGWGNRDWETYETILSGEIGNPGTITDNCYHVFYHPGSLSLDATAVLDGFVITNGYANGDFPQDSDFKGGGMYNDQSSPAITHCRFYNNYAKFGGGMHNNHSEPAIADCIFQDNKSRSDGGGLRNSYSSPTITNCTFYNNATTVNGSGGGMMNDWFSSPIIQNCTLYSNTAIAVGGGMANYESSPLTINCIFYDNSAGDNGGGMYNDMNSSATITNCTFFNNTAGHGGGIGNWNNSSPVITNCILWGSTPAEIGNSASSSPDVTYSVVQGGYTGIFNFDSDPLFVNSGSGDFHLQSTSPCINTGNNAAIQSTGVTVDFEGGDRIVGGTVDVGADEYGSTGPGEQYSLTIASSIGGSVTIPGEGTFVSSGGTVISLETVADEDYVFTGWFGDTSTIADTGDATTTITVNGNYSIMANFSPTNDVGMRIAAGKQHTVGLKINGKVIAVGANFNGQCDTGIWTAITEIAAGDSHTVGLKSDGTVVALGSNANGQCDVDSWTGIRQIAAGNNHTVGLENDGTVVAVGDDSSNQCNIGSWSNIVQIAAGDEHTVGLKEDGSVVAVGNNGSSRCDVVGWAGITQVAAGDEHTVGIQSDGTVVAVGDNGYGQCAVGAWANIEMIAAGALHTVGLENNGTVVAAGQNIDEQLNTGNWVDIEQIAAGEKHTLGMQIDGTVLATGDNTEGQCNVGCWVDIEETAAGWQHSVGLNSEGAVVAGGASWKHQCDVSDWVSITQLSAYGDETFGLKDDGTVVAVGDCFYGQCDVGGWSGITQVAAGHKHVIGLKYDGTVVGAGDTLDGKFREKLNVGSWTNMQYVATGWNHTVGVKNNGSVLAVGWNVDGECNVSGWTDIEQAAAGHKHTVGLKSSGMVVAVGDNSYGQCDVSGWSNISQVATAGDHTVGLRTDGTVVATGLNTDGRCDVSGWTDIIDISAGHEFTLGVKNDGTAVTAGNCEDGNCALYDWNLNRAAAIEDYILNVTSSTGGSVTSPGEGTFSYGPGTIVNLEAVPEAEYIFMGWMGDTSTVDDTDDLTTTMMMNGNYSIQAFFMSQAPTDTVYHAVICGISDYAGSMNDLTYCDKDAEDIRDKLLGFPNWSADNIQLLTNSDATESNIHAAIETMGTNADDNDVCLFFFSGHGSYVSDQTPIDESDGYDELMCPYNISSNQILDDELSSWLDDLPTDQIIVWLDTCFSGGNLKAPGSCTIKSLPGPNGNIAKGDGFATDLERHIVKDVDDLLAPYISTACDDDEVSYEIGSLQNGLYAYYLLEALDNADDGGDGWISGEETFDYLYDPVANFNLYPGYPAQHPQEYDAYPEEARVGQTGNTQAPGVITGEASQVTAYSARLNAMLHSLGAASSVDVSFEYGTQSGVYFYVTSPVSMDSIGDFSTIITGLQPNTKYFFRAKVSGDGIGWGDESEFMTDAVGIVYVDGSASGANNGDSWIDAFVNLREAIDSSSAGEQIWVASGIYTPVLPGQPGTRTASFQMKNSVSIHGGFSGTETAFSQRDWQANLTTLSGDIGVQEYDGDNCYHVLYNRESIALSNSAVLEGFTISGGNADGDSLSHFGGGMLNHHCSPTITSCIFTSNFSSFLGGGMMNMDLASPIVTNCVFRDNFAPFGGGMYNNAHALPVVTNCVFFENTAGQTGGGMYNNNESSAIITNSIFWNNAANDGKEVHSIDSSPIISHSNIQVNPGSSVYAGAGNICTPPVFRDPAAGDFHLRWASPCVDTGINSAQGLPSRDIDGNDRILNGRVDMGIDEYTPPLLEISPGYGLVSSEITITGHHFEGTPVDVTIDGLLVATVITLEDLDGDAGWVILDGVPVIRGIDDFEITAQIPRIVQTSVVEIAASCYDPHNAANFFGAAEFTAAPRTVNCIPNNGPPGTNITITGAGFPPGEPDETWSHALGGIALYKYNRELAPGTITTNIAIDQNGGFSVVGQIPLDSNPGPHDIIIFFDPTDPVFNGSDPDQLAIKGSFMVTQAETRIIYVDASNSGTRNGQSWDTAYADLQDAIGASYQGDEIWVASGIYTPTVVHGGSTPRHQSFQMKNQVGIYGGFDGTEYARSQRDWPVNQTILSGDIGIPGSNIDNCYHVFYHPADLSLNDTAILDGFTIKNGNATGSGAHHDGGGMYNRKASPAIANCIFYNNSASFKSGGMMNFDNSSPIVTNSVFYENTAYNGGGMFNYDQASPVVTNCVFYDNSAIQSGGAMLNSSDASAVLTNTIFWENEASEGKALFNSDSTPTISHCNIQVNPGSPVYPGDGNISADPMFINPQSGDFHLHATSPCVDSGNYLAPNLPAIDFEGDDRVINGSVDIGADEFRAKYTLTIAVSGNGSVHPEPGSYIYYDGEIVNLTTSAEFGWRFEEWTGDTSTIANTIDPNTIIMMDDNYSVTAVFVESCDGGATRTMPDSVSPGTAFYVNIDVSESGSIREVIEILPDGFSYLETSSGSVSVSVASYQVTFSFAENPLQFSYSVQAPIAQDEYSFMGIVKDELMNECFVRGDKSITVTSWDPWNYDTNHDGVVSKQEALVAVVDFFGGQITKQQALQVIVLFFS